MSFVLPRDDGVTPPSRPRVIVLLTAHNRREGTVRCLERLADQEKQAGAALDVVLVDDGSTDGTAEAVRERHPAVRLLRGSGQLYWNGGMRLAMEEAAREDPDFFLLLNDDTHLFPGALASLLETHRTVVSNRRAPCLVVGSTRDPSTGALSYGGWRSRSRLLPGRLQRVPPGVQPMPCDTVNGNCVLISREVFRRVGHLDPAFTHAMGDQDYGFRAARRGCLIFMAPGFVGECTANPGIGSWADGRLPLRDRWRRLVGPKGLPPREWLIFTSRHYGPLWPLSFAWPYVKVLWARPRDSAGSPPAA